MGRYNKSHEVRFKGPIDLVSEADMASEEVILAILQSQDNGIKILSEESCNDYEKVTSEQLWVIDPLDGTTNFVHGFPWFAVSIALMEQGRSLVGVVYAPLLDELFFACCGCGASLNGERIKVSEVSDLFDALLGTGFPYDVRQNHQQVISALQKILTHSQGIRRAGAAALDLASVACGRLDGFWEAKLKPWDTAAGLLLVEEAGGETTDFQGREYSPFFPEIVSSNGKIHAQILAHL